MTSAATFTRDLAVGFARLIADAGIGLTWDESLQYDPGDTGVFIASMPATPNRVVVVTPYPLTNDPTFSDSELGVQFRSRSAGADVRDSWALDDAINNVLLGLFPVTLPTGIRVQSLVWSSGASLGQEDGGARRWTQVSNYTANVHRPSLHRT